MKESPGINLLDSHCYRQLVLGRASTVVDLSVRSAELTAKIKFTLDLVESGLLFLKTSWFAGLCSCSVRLRQAVTSPSGVPLLRTGSVQHINPHYATVQSNHCWCDPAMSPPVPTANNATMNDITREHIRLLGFLLTEIATGCPIFDVRRSLQPDGTIKVELEIVRGATPARHVEDLEDTLVRIRQATSEKYSEAVGYCLNCAKTPDQIEQNDIEQYYWHVLLPIQEYYHKLISRPRLSPKL